MNLVTYASPVSIKPTQRFAVGLYVNTLSWENMLARKKGVLQILSQNHASLVPLLGKESGRNVDKMARLQELGHTITERYGVPTLEDCLGVMHLEIVEGPFSCGDHDVVLCDVTEYETLSTSQPVLYTGWLRENSYL